MTIIRPTITYGCEVWTRRMEQKNGVVGKKNSKNYTWTIWDVVEKITIKRPGR